MQSIPLFKRIAGAAALLGLAACLGACSRPAPLPPELQAIRCPVNRPEHAAATFVNARVTFVCVSKELADSPYLLKCDLTSRPMICEDDGSILLSRGPDGVVYGGLLPGEHKRPDPEALYGGSFVFTKGVTATIDPFTLLAWRFGEVAGHLELGLLAAPMWAAAAGRGASRPIPDFSGPLIMTPMGAIPPGLSAVVARGPDLAVVGSIPVIIALVTGRVTMSLLGMQAVCTAVALYVAVRHPRAEQ